MCDPRVGNYNRYKLLKIQKELEKPMPLQLLAFVGVTGLEPATSRPPDAYSNQLSYTPFFSKAMQSYALFLNLANFFATIFQKNQPVFFIVLT